MSNRWKILAWATVLLACLVTLVWGDDSNGAELTQSPAGLPCAPIEQAAGFLLQTYGETMTEFGLKNDQTRLVALFVSQSGTFTILEISAANGIACIKVAGAGWGTADRAPPPPAVIEPPTPPAIERPKR